MKNATATSHGNNRLLDGLGELTAERIGIAFDTSRTRTRRAWHSDPEIAEADQRLYGIASELPIAGAGTFDTVRSHQTFILVDVSASPE